MTRPVVVRIEESGDDERAFVDDHPVLRDSDETAREAALRTVLAQTEAPRKVDILTPAGVVLHVLAEPGGRLQVLGQTMPHQAPDAVPDAVIDPVPGPVLSGPVLSGPVPTDPPAAEPAGQGTTHGAEAVNAAVPRPGWVLRDRPWPLEAPPDCRDPLVRRSAAPRRSRRSRGVLRRRAGQVHPAHVRPRPHTARARRDMRGPGVLSVVLVALVTVSALAAGLVHLARPEATAPVQTAVGEPFPGTPPDGTGEAVWASPTLEPESSVVVVPDADVVAFVTAEQVLAAVRPDDGEVRWSAPLPPGTLAAGPAPTRLDGTPAIAVRVDDRVLLWSADDGRSLVDVAVPAGSELVLDGPAPLVRIDAATAALVHGSGLQAVDLPAGARALGGREDGTILAASAQGWWHLRPGDPTAPATPWEQMRGQDDPGSLEVVAAAGSSVLLVEPGAASDAGGSGEYPRLLVHHDGDVVRASFEDVYAPGRTSTWAPSPSKSWGILGRSLVDLESGQVTDLGDWQTVLVAEDHAYGLLGNDLHIAGPTRQITSATVTTAVVEAEGPTGSVVRADTDDGPRVWWLEPATDR